MHFGSIENTNIDMVIENEGLPKFLYDKTIDVPAYVLCPCSECGGWGPYMPTIKYFI